VPPARAGRARGGDAGEVDHAVRDEERVLDFECEPQRLVTQLQGLLEAGPGSLVITGDVLRVGEDVERRIERAFVSTGAMDLLAGPRVPPRGVQVAPAMSAQRARPPYAAASAISSRASRAAARLSSNSDRASSALERLTRSLARPMSAGR